MRARELPPEIHDFEVIVRALKTPVHYDIKKKTVKPAAFRPPAESTMISCMRQIMGDDFCKDKAVEIAKVAYVGLLTITAGDIRSTGSTVNDAREDFLGHVHVDHGFPAPPKDEPPESAIARQMRDRCRQLLEVSKFFVDPHPEQAGWHGPPLRGG